MEFRRVLYRSVSQPFRPAWGEFGPLPVASLQETATEDADASGQARHDSASGGKAFPEAIVMHVTRGLLPVGVPVAQQPSRCHGVDPQDRRQAVGEGSVVRRPFLQQQDRDAVRSEEHTSELQSLMRLSYAVFCLKKKKQNKE